MPSYWFDAKMRRLFVHGYVQGSEEGAVEGLFRWLCYGPGEGCQRPWLCVYSIWLFWVSDMIANVNTQVRCQDTAVFLNMFWVIDMCSINKAHTTTYIKKVY